MGAIELLGIASEEGIALGEGVLLREVELAALARNTHASRTAALAISIVGPAQGKACRVKYRSHTVQAQSPTWKVGTAVELAMSCS